MENTGSSPVEAIMNIQDKLTIYDEVIEEVTKLAKRWIKAKYWGDHHATISNIQIHHNIISFVAVPSTSGFNPPYTMKLDYLFDDSTLEEDAKKEEDERRERIRVYSDYMRNAPFNPNQYPLFVY